MRNWGKFLFIVIAGWMASVAFWFEPQSLTLTVLDVQAPAWPNSTAPLRVALLSDIHTDPIHMTPARVRDIVRRVNALHPDIVLLAGDYVGGDWLTGHHKRQEDARSPADNQKLEAGLNALSGFKAPLGAYAVLGNHDCWWNCSHVAALLSANGIHVLDNQAAKVDRPGGAVWIIGMADNITQTPDYATALRGVPDDAATLTLIHEPDPFAYAPAPAGNLQLSGHTHAGQVRLPLIGAPVRNSRYQERTAKGWLVEDNRILVVTRGLGESGIPVRFNAPPQIMLLTIHPGPQARVIAQPDVWLP